MDITCSLTNHKDFFSYKLFLIDKEVTQTKLVNDILKLKNYLKKIVKDSN